MPLAGTRASRVVERVLDDAHHDAAALAAQIGTGAVLGQIGIVGQDRNRLENAIGGNAGLGLAHRLASPLNGIALRPTPRR
jgi:hypothetical protein